MNNSQPVFPADVHVLTRSMPRADAHSGGQVYDAFGLGVAAIGALPRRMVGLDDGVVDGLFGVARPVTGSYFRCPPMQDGRLVLHTLNS